ncbi:MAG: hypothetical protein LBL55_11410 [Propionibacteriaceae bacterium]|jgi:hypothetical protein|nr:hypothetical protein [Propionibacteriaceae bacterium]
MELTKFGHEVVRVEVGGHLMTLTVAGAARLGAKAAVGRPAVSPSGLPAPPKPRITLARLVGRPPESSTPAVTAEVVLAGNDKEKNNGSD